MKKLWWATFFFSNCSKLEWKGESSDSPQGVSNLCLEHLSWKTTNTVQWFDQVIPPLCRGYPVSPKPLQGERTAPIVLSDGCVDCEGGRGRGGEPNSLFQSHPSGRERRKSSRRAMRENNKAKKGAESVDVHKGGFRFQVSRSFFLIPWKNTLAGLSIAFDPLNKPQFPLTALANAQPRARSFSS